MGRVSGAGVRLHALGMHALAVAAGLVVAAVAPRAGAFEYFDGRLEVHGFFEEQIRALGEDFSWSNDIDLAQWYNVLSIEVEYDFAPEGWGPFDILSGFARVEARYDCVWTRACGMFPSADAFGNRVAHLPGYKTTGRRTGFYGSINIADTVNAIGIRNEVGRYTKLRYEPYNDPRTNDIDAAVTSKLFLDCDTSDGTRTNEDLDQPHTRCVAELFEQNGRKPARVDQLAGLSGLFAVAGANQTFEANGNVFTALVANPRFGSGGDGSEYEYVYSTVNDDPAYYYFSGQLRCRFGSRKVPGGANGLSEMIIGPIDPRCYIQPQGALNNKPNPFNPDDLNPLIVDRVTGLPKGGSGELPARPASVKALGQPFGHRDSRGVFYPSGRFNNWIRDHEASQFDENFSQDELAWNRGGSQQDEKEFKEGYLDMEFFDSRLWIRAGKQNIVWGKTELFRTTDQFNPQDLALASLPSLEESRIALWSVRGVWSFYDVGPLEDLRLELAMNLDDFEPADIGRCGEPFTALVACNKTTALWAHGLLGVALAGEHRPPNWWNSASGLEYGARLEWRYGKFSFQLSDYYGYNDFPHVEKLNIYERNADYGTGRPRRAGATGRCVTGFEEACLPIQSNLSLGPADPKSSDTAANNGSLNPVVTSNRQNIIDTQSANLQIFAAICATSIGFNSVDPTACGQSVFNSKVDVFDFIVGALQPAPVPDSERKTGASISALLANTLAGNTPAANLVRQGFTFTDFTPPYVPLIQDPCDAFLSNNDGTCSSITGRTRTSAYSFRSLTLNQVLTDEQEALVGCGPFFGTDCEADGMDLLNAEASALMQSFMGAEGRYTNNGNLYPGWRYGLTDAQGNPLPQPGTQKFVGGPIATRWDGDQTVQLPGVQPEYLSNGSINPKWNRNVDGSVDVTGGAWQCAGSTVLSIPCADLGGMPFPDGGFGASGGLPFKSEIATLSWNLQTTLVAFSAPSSTVLANVRAGIGQIEQDEFNPDDPFSIAPGQCSYNQPQYCSSWKSFVSITGTQRNAVRAGGDGSYGRRDFQWHVGSEGVLEYQKRNVLGFSLDFAEDVTKSNWGMEAAWINNVRFTDNNARSGLNTGDTINVTISVDRPTFINFLNPNRTFFFNSQFFFQYITDYRSGYVNNGPFNVLGTFTIQTGYFQDRLLPSVTFVYDVNSASGAALPQVTYRFTENFSASVGMNFFWGRWEFEDMPLVGLGTAGSEVGEHAYKDAVENGLAVVRERDEAYLRLRYTF